MLWQVERTTLVVPGERNALRRATKRIPNPGATNIVLNPLIPLHARRVDRPHAIGGAATRAGMEPRSRDITSISQVERISPSSIAMKLWRERTDLSSTMNVEGNADSQVFSGCEGDANER